MLPFFLMGLFHPKTGKTETKIATGSPMQGAGGDV